MTKRIVGIGIILIVIYVAMGGVALSVGHIPFASSTDQCACHRSHTATSGYLLVVTNGNALCMSCHWAGIGADTDVKNGFYNTGGESDHAWGDSNGILLAGGFEKVGNAQASTSMHILDTALKPPGTTTGALITLGCMSCHTAHSGSGGEGQYRMLRFQPNGATPDKIVTWNGPWTDNTQTTYQANGYRAYTEKDWNPYLTGVQTITHNYKTGLSDWCVSCHTVYKTPVDSAPYNPGDAYTGEPRYRHMVDIAIKDVVDETTGFTYDLDSELPLEQVSGSVPSDLDKVMCLTCHRAHGTDATITARIVQYYNVDRGLLPKGSTLLRKNNTGVCVDCHTNI